jgi:deoxyhypusine synthase
MPKQSTEHYLPRKKADLSTLPKIRGYDFEKGLSFKEFLHSLNTTGMQASKLGQAIETVKMMRENHATIFLSYTSNMISSGIREHIKYLVKHKLVHVLITNAGGIEEDFMKCFQDFSLGDFRVHGRMLNEHGINRIGNIYVEDEVYAKFEIEMHKILEECYKLQKDLGRPLCTSEITHQMGKYMADSHMDNREDSIVYWAYKNNIPIFSPAFTDGSIGDMIYFHKHNRKDLYVDISQDMERIIKIALNSEKNGVILLGGGSAKHYVLNAQIFHDGADYAVYLNSHDENDGSDSGADPSEAVTWTKIKPEAPQVKVHGDATITFPLLVAGGWFD